MNGWGTASADGAANKRMAARNNSPVCWAPVFAALILLSGCVFFGGRPDADAPRNGEPAKSGTSVGVMSADWVQTTKDDFGLGATEKIDISSRGDGELRLALLAGQYSSRGVYTSTVKQSSFVFNAVGIRWRAQVPSRTGIIGEARTSADGTSYSEWKPIATGSDAEDRAGEGDYVAELLLTPSHRWLQYRFTLTTDDARVSPTVEEVAVSFIDSSRGPNLAQARAAAIQPKAVGQPAIIPRSAWGADEKLRYKDGKEAWPPEHSPVQKFILHHTYTRNDDPNPPATVRAIHQYHALRLGWGDIGYNYLIDAQGNVYEGRYGGEDVAAGHAKQYNSGSVGIAVLGDYSATGISNAAKDSLINLIAWSASRNGVDPLGNTYFADRAFPNISGHLDLLPTSCPGGFLENELPGIRSRVASQLPPPTPTPAPPAATRSTWYFAEGSTMQGYRTTFQLMNPNPDPANVALTFMLESGATSQYSVTVRPTSRLTLDANGIVPNANMSTRIQSDRRIYAERTMLFGHDGHSSPGTEAPAPVWYFAEGSTGWGFGTWLLLMNPNAEEAKAAVTFYGEKGLPVVKNFRLKPTSRLNIYVNKEVPNANVAAKVESDRPIVAERSMYLDGGRGGHGSPGVTGGSTTWLFAEGYTGSGVSTWLLLMNPNQTGVTVTVSFFKESGPPIVKVYNLAPTSRYNLPINEIARDTAVSMKVEATAPIVAERSMYFADGKGAHNTVGATRAAGTWYLPEGYVGSGVGEWVLIFNPEPVEAKIDLDFMRNDGTVTIASVVVAPASRRTLYLNRMVSEGEHSTRIAASKPIVVERASYFNNGQGGTVSFAIPDGP